MEITWELETQRAELRGARVATEHEMAAQASEDAATTEGVWMDLVAAFDRDREIEAVPVVTVAPKATVTVPGRKLSLRSLVSRFIPVITRSLAWA